MKKSIKTIIMLLFISVNAMFAQNIIDPPKLYDKNDTSNVVGRVYEENTLSFLRGWNWAGYYGKLDTALEINTYHYMWTNATTGVESPIVIQMPEAQQPYVDPLYFSRVKISVMGGLGMILEPTLKVDSTQSFRSRYNGKNGAVFGFNNIDLTHGDTSWTVFDCYTLHQNSFTEPPGYSIKVLSDIWDGTILRYMDYDKINDLINPDGANDVQNYHPYNGKMWYISIKLKAIDPAQIIGHENDIVLSIEIPYRCQVPGSNASATFVSLDDPYFKLDNCKLFITSDNPGNKNVLRIKMPLGKNLSELNALSELKGEIERSFNSEILPNSNMNF